MDYAHHEDEQGEQSRYSIHSFFSAISTSAQDNNIEMRVKEQEVMSLTALINQLRSW